MSFDISERVWFTKYRPSKIADCILPSTLAAEFQAYVDSGFFPNLLIVGGQGMGKTTVAKALCDELGMDSMFINGSLKGGIDTLRTDMQQFAVTVPMSGNRKCLIVDEADHLSNATQAAMRTFMEEYAENCAFILTANYKARVIEPLWSRCSVVDFNFPSENKKDLLARFFKRVAWMLEQEGITYDKKAVGQLIVKHYPDFRRTINELQRHSATGTIDAGILTSINQDDFEELYAAIKGKDFPLVRKWIGEHADLSPELVFRKFYDDMNRELVPASIPPIVLAIAQYQYQSAFVADQEINLAACCVDIMASAVWR